MKDLFTNDIIIMSNQLANIDGAPGDIVNLVATILLWTIGYLAAPIVFVATLGVFRNLAGMGTGVFKGLSGKMRQPGAQRRSWGKSGREEISRQKAVNRGATRWKTRRRGMQEQYRESTKMLKTKEAFHEDITNVNPTTRQERARRGMSEKVLRQAKAEQSRDDKAQADYALQSGGIDNRYERFTAQHNGIEYKDLEKDQALVLAGLGAKVQNSRGETLADGSSGSMRAAQDLAAKQGIAKVMNQIRGTDQLSLQDAQGNTRLIDGVDQLSTQARAMGAPQETVKNFQEAASAFSEAMDTNANSMLAKTPSYYKTPQGAFNNIDAGTLAKFDKSEGKNLVKWISDASNFSTQQEHNEVVARVGESLRRIAEEPAKYNATPDLLRNIKQGIDQNQANIPTQAFTSEMSAAIDKIDSSTGIIR